MAIKTVYMLSYVTSHLLIIFSLDHGAIYTILLAVCTVHNSMCLRQSTLGDRASEQLHRRNQDRVSSRQWKISWYAPLQQWL